MMVMMMMVMVRMMMVPLCGSDLYGMYIKTGVFAKKRCMLSFVHKTNRLSGHLLELQNWIFSCQHIFSFFGRDQVHLCHQSLTQKNTSLNTGCCWVDINIVDIKIYIFLDLLLLTTVARLISKSTCFSQLPGKASLINRNKSVKICFAEHQFRQQIQQDHTIENLPKKVRKRVQNGRLVPTCLSSPKLFTTQSVQVLF